MYTSCLISILTALVGMGGIFAIPGQAIGLERQVEISQNSKSSCPVTIEPLTEELLKDLPSYANRAIQRSRSVSSAYEPTNVVTAGSPEFEPLPLAPNQPIPDDPRQVFITTLERTHGTGQVVEIQHFHWLFLTRNQSGWWLALMFSSIGAGENQPPSPPRESSQGAIAQAIRTWLRDCRARGELSKK